ncbi:MAG: hypothetical protein H0X37_09080 [Herpetosiphonaceae bacterium]|nr:hypothetical protein [Herpetosiphonaceae bacterium]
MPDVQATVPFEAEQLAAILERTYPQTVAAFRAMEALPSLSAIARLDRRWQNNERGGAPAQLHQVVKALPPMEAQYDLIYAGGGLGLLHAAVMAGRYGYRVLLFDRDEVGCAHREWNISDAELEELVRLGLFTRSELEAVIMRRYRDGVVRFDATGTGVAPAELHLPEVLNVGLDAGGLLRKTRAVLEAAGGTVLDFQSFVQVQVARTGGVAVEFTDQQGKHHCYGGRLLMDGMGATSPLAQLRYAGQPFAGVCPTVGTIVSGLEEGSGIGQHNPEVGDILVSVAGMQHNRQLIWEGFAGRGDELTVYVFYYDLLDERARRRLISAQKHSLLDLFEDYFTFLPTYKQPGPGFRHLKPVYGFIPARHTQRRTTALPLLGVLPVGDANAQQSPLTFCGFGSHVRNLDRTTILLDWALNHDVLQPSDLQYISAYQANVALNWVFSRFMQPWDGAQDVNRLQNVFARVLNELGTEIAVRFFQDQMRWGDYGRIVNHTLAVYPPIIRTTLRVLGPRQTLRWVVDYVRFSGSALAATAGRAVGKRRWFALASAVARTRPALALRLRAAWAEWQAMGWVAREE